MPSSHSEQSDDGEEPILVESSESEPEFECDGWDTECKIHDQPLLPSALCGFYCAKTEEAALTAVVEKTPELRGDLKAEKFVGEFREKWAGTEGVSGAVGGVEIVREPFKVGVVQDFLEDGGEFLLKLRDEFNQIEWNQRSLDLYEFYQSKDLEQVELPHLKLLYEFLKNDVMKWVNKIYFLKLFSTLSYIRACVS